MRESPMHRIGARDIFYNNAARFLRLPPSNPLQ